MANYDGSIRINTQIESKDVTSQMLKIVNSIKKSEAEIQRLQAKMNELANTKMPTSEYEKLKKELASTIQKYEQAKDVVETFQKIGTDTKSMPFRMARDEAQELYMKIEDIRGAMFQLEDTGKAFTLGSDTDEFAKSSAKVQELSNNIEVSKLRLSELQKKQTPIAKGFDNVKKSAEKSLKAISSGVQKSSGLLATFRSRLKGIALSLLIFNWITKAFNGMLSGMKKGFENLMNYSSDYANSVQSLKNAMATLGNQFAAAFSTIIQMVIPWLTKLISAISTVMSYVSQFIAILGGKSTFTRAKQVQDSYNKSLSGTASAAKKAYGALAKFDDLDVLQQQEDAGGGSAEVAGDMFEEVPVDSDFKDWLNGILEKLKPILDYLKKLKDIFMEGFLDGLGDWEYRLEIIKDAIASIKDSLIDIFTDPAVIASADAWAQSVAYMLGSLVGSMASIGLTMAANLLGGISKYLEQNTDRIKEYLISMFDISTEINYLLADLFQTIAYIFEAFASEDGQQLTANIIGIFVDSFIGITELALKFARDILNIIIQPFVDNKEALRTALEGLLSVLSDVTGTIKDSIDETFDKLNEVYDAHFKPFFDSIANGLSEITGKFLDFWNGSVQPILEKWAEKFDVLWKNHMQPLINSLAEFIGSVADLLKALWEQYLKPFVDWIIENILPIILPILDALYTTLVTVIGDIGDILSNFINKLTSIVNLVVALINGDWQGAWESLKSIVENAFNTILSFTKTIWDSFVGVINVALQTILGIFKSIFLSIYDFLAFTWNSIYETTLEIWTIIMEWFTETFNTFYEFIVYILESIALFFTETWENIQLLFETFMTYITETIIPMWQEAWETAGNLFQTFKDLLKKLSDAIKELFSGLMKSVKLLIDGDWKGAWDNAKNIFTSFKEKVDSIISSLRSLLESFFDWVSSMISNVIESLSNIGSSIKNAFSGGVGSASVSVAGANYVSFSTDNIPALASGSVIRGGNPFLAMLGDQPRGQTNIEAPLDTIKQAVREEMSGLNIVGINPTISLNVDGQEFARLTLNDILQEAARQGYDVSVLGVT